MPLVTVHKAECGKGAAINPFFLKVEETIEAVRKRAFDLFEKRGCAPGGDVGDWLQAEQELFFVPAVEIAETDKAFTMKLTMSGFAVGYIEVMTRPSEIVVRATSEKGKSGKCASGDTGGAVCKAELKSLYRYFVLPRTIDASKVKARLDKEILTIEAPKVVPKSASQPVWVPSIAA
jgi:HSP20 family molecular chaperone IbpA